MANFTTTSDYVNYILRSMNELTNGTSPFEEDVLNHLNHVYRLIYAGGAELNAGEKRKPLHLPWARSQYPYVLNMEAPVTTGTVSVTLNSTAIVFSSAPAASVAGWHFKVDDDPEVYRIASHSGGSPNATLDSAFVGSTDAAGTYKAFKIRYTIGTDILGFSTPIRAYNDTQRGNDGRRQIDVVSETQFDARWPLSAIRQEFPVNAKIVYSDGNGSFDVVFNSYPDAAERLEVDYVKIPTPLDKVGSNPVLPIQWRPVLAEYALLFLYRDSNDDRAGSQSAVAKSKFEGVVSEAEGLTRISNFQYGRIYPRGDQGGVLDSLVKTKDGFILS